METKKEISETSMAVIHTIIYAIGLLDYQRFSYFLIFFSFKSEVSDFQTAHLQERTDYLSKDLKK